MIKLFTDGASRGNPGEAAIGAVAYEDENKLFDISEYLGIQTNNYAEYTALLIALRKLIELGKNNEKLEIYADSKLLVEQLNGNWKVKNENIKSVFNEVKSLLSNFSDYSIKHVYRENNKEADMLANIALDSL